MASKIRGPFENPSTGLRPAGMRYCVSQFLFPPCSSFCKTLCRCYPYIYAVSRSSPPSVRPFCDDFIITRDIDGGNASAVRRIFASCENAGATLASVCRHTFGRLQGFVCGFFLSVCLRRHDHYLPAIVNALVAIVRIASVISHPATGVAGQDHGGQNGFIRKGETFDSSLFFPVRICRNRYEVVWTRYRSLPL